MEKPLWFCHRILEFSHLVAELRGQQWDSLEPLVQGDSGQLWFKLAMGLIDTEELLELVGEEGGVKKRRRTREEVIEGIGRFRSWGVRKLLVLAVVQGVPESNHNLDIIFSAVSIQLLRFKLTGDLHFIMPCLGCMSNSSSNPCPFCPLVRSNVGGVLRWEEKEVELRTMGDLHTDYSVVFRG